MLWKTRRRIADFIINPRKEFKSFVHPPYAFNLIADRDIEKSWVSAYMPEGPGTALDFGSGNSSLGLMAAMKGFDVTAVDLREIEWLYVHARLRFQRGDILEMDFVDGAYDLIINCSSIEHVGLIGRYGVAKDQGDGDLEAMRKLGRLMRPGAWMLLTIPVGRDAVFAPYCRVYGEQRLPQLLQGFSVAHDEYWIKNDRNQWVETSRSVALAKEARVTSGDPMRTCYGLGCIALRKIEN